MFGICWVCAINIKYICWISIESKYQSDWNTLFSYVSNTLVTLSPNSQIPKTIKKMSIKTSEVGASSDRSHESKDLNSNYSIYFKKKKFNKNMLKMSVLYSLPFELEIPKGEYKYLIKPIQRKRKVQTQELC